jgi:hypothetical protein
MEIKIADPIMFAMTAGIAAVALLVVMHHDLGLSRVTIRIDALLSAATTGAVLMIALLKFPTTK